MTIIDVLGFFYRSPIGIGVVTVTHDTKPFFFVTGFVWRIKSGESAFRAAITMYELSDPFNHWVLVFFFM